MATERDDIDLMRYHDGELDTDEHADVEERLAAGDPDDAAVLEALAEMGETVRTYVELEADDAGPRLDGMWDAIERRIGANGVAEDAAVPAKVGAPDGDDKGGVWAAVGRWFEGFRGHMVTGAVAAAAAALLVVWLRPGADGERVTVKQPGPAPVEPMPVTQPEPTQPEVEELDVVDGSGAVLMIPGEEGEADTAVIWVTPDDILEDPI